MAATPQARPSPQTIFSALDKAGGGMYFSYRRDGIRIDIGITDPTEKERIDYLEGPIAFALVPMGQVLFLLANVGGKWVCDAPFSIQVEPIDHQALPWSGKDPEAMVFFVNIYMAEGRKWQRTHRVASLSSSMLRALQECVSQQLGTPLSRAEYERIVRETYAKYPKTSWMVKKAVAYELAIPGRTIAAER